MLSGQPSNALVGKAGEALVAAELLRRYVDVAYPAHDHGVDLIAYRGHNFGRVVPIQVKTRAETNFAFQRSWFRDGIVLVQVWCATISPAFYIFSELSQVEHALGESAARSASWRRDGRYNVTHPTLDQKGRMEPHKDQWSRIIDRL
jgi:hypothetical protein